MWIRLDDGFADHPKVIEAGPLAAWLHVKALVYCGRHLTDGRIPKSAVPSMVDWSSSNILIETDGNGLVGSCTPPDNALLAARLVDVGLWHEYDNAFIIHDYLKYQPSKAAVIAEREATRVRVERHRSKSNGQFGNGVTNAFVTPAPGNARPDPSRSEKKTEQKKPEEAPARSAGRRKSAKSDRPGLGELVATYREAWTLAHSADGKPPAIEGADLSAITRLHDTHGIDETKALIQRFVSDDDPFIKRRGHILRDLPSRVNSYRARPTNGTAAVHKRNHREPMKHQEQTVDETKLL